MSRWEKRALGQVCELISGQHIMAEDYNSHGVGTPYLTGPSDFGALHPTISKWTNKPKVIAIEGDILVTVKGSGVGKVNRLQTGRAAISRQLMAVRPVHVDRRFAYYFLKSRSAKLQEESTGAAIPGLSREQILSLLIPTPSYVEQQRVVAILDEVFARLATMRTNAEASLKNASALFDSHLNAVFSKAGNGWRRTTFGEVCNTQYGISGPMDAEGAGFKIFRMGEVQRGRMIDTGSMKRIDITQKEFELYRLHPGDVLFNRTNSIDLVGKAGIFEGEGDYCFASYLIRLNIDRDQVDPRFLCYFMNSPQFLKRIRAKAARSVSQANINATILRNEALPLHHDLAVQRKIADRLDSLSQDVARLELVYNRKLFAVDTLQQSILVKAFAGELVVDAIAQPIIVNTNTSRNRHPAAVILARAYARHRRNGRDKSFGHVKAQKILHMVEAAAGYDLGRRPIKDAAGPNDMPHMGKAERWAEDHSYFKFPRTSGGGYRLEPLENFDALLRDGDAIDCATLKEIDRVIDLFAPMDRQASELFATVYAAWNNLLIDGETPTDDAIVREAREDWHEDKLKIDRVEFVKALAAVRRSGMIPTGNGKRVGAWQPRLL